MVIQIEKHLMDTNNNNYGDIGSSVINGNKYTTSLSKSFYNNHGGKKERT